MNLVGTLAKVAVGVMVARGVGSMLSGGSKSAASPQGGGLGGLGDLLGGLTGGGQQANLQPGQQSSGGGLGGLLGGLAGGGGQQGGLGGLLGGLAGGGGQQGGLGGLLGGLAGGAAGQRQGGGQPQGGLGDLLGGLASQQGGLGGMLGNILAGGAAQNSDHPAAQPRSAPMAGGLGGLLDSLAGGGGRSEQAGTSLGGMFNQALAGQAPPAPEPHHNAQAEILLRAMINAAKSDGEIDPQEQKMIVEHLGDVSQDEIAFVRNEMARPLDVDAFVRSVPADLKQQVYLMSLLGIKLDSQAEAQYLDRLATGLGISPEESNHIHTQVGVPPLYS